MKRWWLLVLLLPALLLAAQPASAAVFYDQGDTVGCYMNIWDGGNYTVQTYCGVTYNDYIQAWGIGNGEFYLLDMTDGGSTCIGNLNGAQYDAQAGANDFCSASGSSWGTIFKLGPSCGNGFYKYYNVHWRSYYGLPNSNGALNFLNTSIGSCLKQMDPPVTGTVRAAHPRGPPPTTP